MKSCVDLKVFVLICALLIAIPSFGAGRAAQEITIPAGTTVQVRMIDGISSDMNAPGQTFRGSLDRPIVVNNRTIFPRGATAYVTLVDVRSAGDIKGRSELTVRLDRIVTSGHTYNINSTPVMVRGSSQGKKTAKSAGIGAAVGGGLGALFGGGSGAAIGAGLGAGTGVVTRAVKGGKPVYIGSESLLSFRLTAPIRLR